MRELSAMLIFSLRSRSVIRTLACWRRHAPAVQLALAIALGQGLVWFFGYEWLSVFVTLLGLSLCVPAVRSSSWLAGGIIVGLLSALVPRPEGATGLFQREEISVFGVVQGVPRHPRPGEVTFEIKGTPSSEGRLFRFRAIDLPWRNAAHLQPGDKVIVRGVCNQVEKPTNPFSWQGWLWRRGVSAECKARFVSRPASRASPLMYRLRQDVLRRVFTAVGDGQGVGLFLSMALGYQDLLSMPLEKAFTRLGLTHLLVVSGYQVSLMFGFILSCGTFIMARTRLVGRTIRTAMTLCAFSFAVVYVLFIGAEMSAVRALLAAACVCAHLLSDRETSFAQRWGVALLGMQMLWPWCFFDIGVVLTFAALFGIGLGSELAPDSKLRAFVAVTGTVWLCTSIVIVAWQGALSPLGLLLNLLIAAPWSIVNCTFGLLALAVLVSGIPFASHPLMLLAWVNEKLSRAVLFIGESTFGGWQLVGVSRPITVLCLAMAVVLLLRRHASVKRVQLI